MGLGRVGPGVEVEVEVEEREPVETSVLIPPQAYLRAVRSTLGIIDLDPCSSAKAQQLIDAQGWYRAEDARSALAEPWTGRVFLHPHPERHTARRQLQKLLLDYLADRVSAAIILTNQIDWLRSEPLLLSFPFLLHYRRMPHWRWSNERNELEKFNPPHYHTTIYLPAKVGRHIDEEKLQVFSERFSPIGRVILAEDFGDGWQQQALVATARAQTKPVLTESRLNRWQEEES